MGEYFALSNIWKGSASSNDGELVKITKDGTRFKVELTTRHSKEEVVKSLQPLFLSKPSSIISLVRLALQDTLLNCEPECVCAFSYQFSGPSFSLLYDPENNINFPEDPCYDPDSSLESREEIEAQFLEKINPIRMKLVDNIIGFVEDFLSILND